MRLCFLIVLMLATANGQSFQLQETDALITIFRGSSPVLVYHKAEDPAPEGADPAFKRSGFIHPLCTPSGAVVTGIRPPDHLHHMGLWHAWVHCVFKGRQTDFWNLKAKTGTVRFVKTVATDEANDHASFTVDQEQVAMDADGSETVVLRDRLTVLARFEENANVVDYTVTQKNVSDAALELPAYRYGGGIAFRGPAGWSNDNSDYLTSEGKTRADSHETRARWCTMFGPTDQGDATVAILGHPSNHDAPQRLRTWGPKNHNGAIFFNFVPIQETAWAIGPGEEITLRYQVITSDGKPDSIDPEARWKIFAGKSGRP